MISAQEFLQTKFPTEEGKKKVKTLSICSYYPYSSVNPNPTDEEHYYFAGTWLNGELDLSDFVNLESLYIRDQSQISLKGCEKLEKLENIKVSDNLSLGYREFIKLSRELDQAKKESWKLQQDLFSLQEETLLDNEKIEKLTKEKEDLEKKNQLLNEQLEEIIFKEATLEEKIRIKKNRLESIKKNYEEKIGSELYFFLLKILLVSQEQIVRLEGSDPKLIFLNKEQFSSAKEKLTGRLAEGEINNICQVQIDLTKLEVQQEKLQEINKTEVDLAKS